MKSFVISILLFLLFVNPCMAQKNGEKAIVQEIVTTTNDTTTITNSGLINLQTKANLYDDVIGELHAHRNYIQTLDDNFFKRLELLGSIIVALFIIFGTVVGWLIKSSTKTFINNAKEDAIKKADQEIEKIITIENINDKFKESQKNIFEKQAKILDERVKVMSEEFTNELLKIKNDFVSNEHETIVTVLRDQVGEQFKKPLEILKRTRKLEEDWDTLSTRQTEILKLLDTLSAEIKDLKDKYNYRNKISDLYRNLSSDLYTGSDFASTDYKLKSNDSNLKVIVDPNNGLIRFDQDTLEKSGIDDNLYDINNEE